MNTTTTVTPILRSLRAATLLAVAGLCSLAHVTDCSADIGLAEWSIKTPGKNLIAHADPLSAEHGVYLRRATDAAKANEKVVFVSHIQWWTYYKDHVVGKAKKGIFVFDERAKTTKYVKDSTNLDDQIKKLKLGKPLSGRLVPQDGWNMNWGPMFKGLYQKQLKELEAGTGVAKDLSDAQREMLKKTYTDMLQKIEKTNAKKIVK